jgi:hypothetical protein
MIGFFRRIRKKLVDDNQFLKSSRYAVREIVVVMAGILLASLDTKSRPIGYGI